jgi:hypothetical protein
MAMVVSRRTLPPHQHRAIRRMPPMDVEGSFFRGLAFALPLSLLVWFVLIWALREAV